jgi:hypothetical protein
MTEELSRTLNHEYPLSNSGQADEDISSFRFDSIAFKEGNTLEQVFFPLKHSNL